MNHTASIIASTGSYLPKAIVANDDLSKTLDTSDEWIATRTGIRQRHIANQTETTAYMGAQAAARALAKLADKEILIDGIIVGTTTPDTTFPSVATKIQAMLGIKDAFAFDVQAVCSGFVYALSVANSMIATGRARNVLVIGVDSMSKLVDWSDRNTAVLFGDGAGAAVVSADTEASDGRGIIDCFIKSDGNFCNLLCTNGGAASTQTVGHVTMNGREIFKHAVEKMAAAAQLVLQRNQLTAEDVDWVIPHQANYRIMTAVIERLEVPTEKLLSTVDKHANTSAATIPIVMDCCADKLRKNDLILITALGGGLTWGSALIRW